DLPQGAGPIDFIKDFGDTAALMLTVASPKASDLDIDLRAKAIQPVIERARSQVVAPPAGASAPERAALIVCLPQSITGGTGGTGGIEGNLQMMRKHSALFVAYLDE